MPAASHAEYYLGANLMEHISKLGNVVVRAGCGEFDGERNVYVDVGLSQVDREY